jgi:subtilisin family serine protease
MAKHQSRRSDIKNSRKRGVVLSLSLSLLLLTPLLLRGVFFPAPGKSSASPGQPSSSSARESITSAPDPNPRTYDANVNPIPGQLIVRFRENYVPALAKALHDANFLNFDFQDSLVGASLDGPRLYNTLPELVGLFQRYNVQKAEAIIPETGAYLLKLNPDFEPRALAQEFTGSGFFDYAEPDFPVYAFRDPNDPLYRSQQNTLRQINAPDAWDLSTGSDNVMIAIIDSGVLATHPDLSGKVLSGKNFAAEPANLDTTDDNGHGTYVAGIAAANTNNNIGMSGIAWNSKILPVKVLNADGIGTNATIAKGIRYASERGAQVINISLGGPNRSQVVEDAVRIAYTQGAVLVASVGNNGTNQPNYPAAYDMVIGVGAFNARGEAATFSNYGLDLSISAPGSSIIGPWIGSGSQAYIYDNGTSCAAPFVAGTVALMLSANPSLSNSQVRNILEGTADNSKPGNPAVPASGNPGVQANSLGSGYDTRLGWGRLNVFKAVQAAQRGDLYPSQRGRIIGTVSGVDPLDTVLSIQPGDSRVPDANGAFAFNNLPPGEYNLKLESKKYGIIEGPATFRVRGVDGEFYIQDFDLGRQVKAEMNSGKPIASFQQVDTDFINPLGQRYFPETGHFVKSRFLKFWLKSGKLPILGLPISEEFEERNPDDGKSYRVQYFERVILEYHPEYAGTDDEIQIRRLGSERVKNRTEKEFEPVLPPAIQFVEGRIVTPPYSYFTETRHTLRGKFLDYWKANGGLPIFGLPVSEEMEENGRQVQYFERYRLEIHPENAGTPWEIVGSLLARDSAQAHGYLGRPG